MSLLGKNEVSNNGDINSFLKAGGVDLDAAQTAWCAGFVNSSLKQIGVDGTGSLTANSFLNWGKSIDPSQVLRGDVLVESRGLGAEATGGHVGLATGATQIANGQQQLQMLSGNSSNSVKTSWVNADDVSVRRASQSLDQLSTNSTSASSSVNSLGGATGTAADGLNSLGGGLSKFGQALSSAQSSGASGLVSLLGSLTGYGQSVFNSSSQFAGAITSGQIGLFDGGGYTGPGARHQAAGLVHAGEVVWSQDDIARWGGVGVVDRMRTSRPGYGYADGGIGGQAPRRSTIGDATDRHVQGAAGSGGGTHITFGVTVDDEGNLKAYVKNVAQTESSRAASDGIDRFSKKGLPGRLKEINLNPRKYG